MSTPFEPVNFGFQADTPMSGFMHDVQRTLVQQDDFNGIGGHGLQDHHGGLHSQISIGMGDPNRTINFREFQP